MMSAEPHVRVAPEPLRVDPVRTTELVCPDLDLSVTLTPERPAERRHRQVRFNVSPERSGHSEPDPAFITVIPEPRNHQTTARKPQHKDKHGHESDSGSVRVTEGAELNTTLALRAELQEVENQVFDPERAVKDKLLSSSLTKNHVGSKAAEGLNFPRSQHLYRALVSVSLSRDQLISQALQDRPAMAPPTVSQTNKFSSQPLEAPDLQPFYSPDKMLRETPLLPGDRIPLPRPRPVPRPAHTTFHLHHRHKLWES
ncbi:protein phosphatase 1 regulatory subunit 35 [Garra rufa]|uniref:protein phosphatase 1 regulatory subunit 35 n=1 Tax=Garra rufa TaxID=137080 RepID=UPI003CCEEBB4